MKVENPLITAICICINCLSLHWLENNLLHEERFRTNNYWNLFKRFLFVQIKSHHWDRNKDFYNLVEKVVNNAIVHALCMINFLNETSWLNKVINSLLLCTSLSSFQVLVIVLAVVVIQYLNCRIVDLADSRHDFNKIFRLFVTFVPTRGTVNNVVFVWNVV